MAARSVGEAIATGLESGLNLGMGLANQRRQQERQDRFDVQAAEDRTRGLQRQETADRGAALDKQAGLLKTEGEGLIDAPPEVQREYAGRVESLGQARNEHLSKISGFLSTTKKEADVDLKTLNTGDVSKVRNLARVVTVSTGQDPRVFMRPEGGPSPIEEAGQAMLEGIQSGDTKRMVQGANVLFGPKLQVGVGKPSPHGGTIVRKEIINVVPAPGGDPKDPKFIPVLRVYVKKDGFNGPGDPEKDGATGHYDAPLTDDRSSGDEAKVKALGFKDIGDYVGHNMHLAELLNQPEGLAKLQQDAQSTEPFDPQEYLRALRSVGGDIPKAGKNSYTLREGEVRVDETTDARTGRVTSSRRTEGNPKTPSKNRAEELMDAKLNELDISLDAGEITRKDYDTQKRSIISGIRPGKYTGDAPSGGSGKGSGSGSGDGISAGENRRLQRLNDSLKGDAETVKEDKKEAQRLYEKQVDAAKEIASPAKRQAATKEAEDNYRATLKELKDKDAEIAKRRDKVQDKLEGGAEEKKAQAAPTLGDAKRQGTTPLPKSKDALKAGSIYQTSRGPAKWNGTAFEAAR